MANSYASDYIKNSSAGGGYLSVVEITTSSTISGWSTVNLVNCSSGNLTITLPASTTTDANKMVYIKKVDSSTNYVKIIPNGTNTINGLTAPIYLYNKDDGIQLMCESTTDSITLPDSKNIVYPLISNIYASNELVSAADGYYIFASSYTGTLPTGVTTNDIWRLSSTTWIKYMSYDDITTSIYVGNSTSNKVMYYKENGTWVKGSYNYQKQITGLSDKEVKLFGSSVSFPLEDDYIYDRNIFSVATEADLTNALGYCNNGDTILLTADILATATINISKSIKLDGAGNRTITGTDPVTVINVTANDVYITNNITVVHNKTTNTSVEAAINVNALRFVSHANVIFMETGYVLKGSFNVSNCNTTYNGALANTHRHFIVYSVLDNSKIDGVTYDFPSEATPKDSFIYTSITDKFNAVLKVSNNYPADKTKVCRQFYLQDSMIYDTKPSMIFENNYFNDLNGGIGIVGAIDLSPLDDFNYIALLNNYQGDAAIATDVYKGMVYVDGSSTSGTHVMGTTKVYSVGNIHPTKLRTDYTSALNIGDIAYKNTVYSTTTITSELSLKDKNNIYNYLRNIDYTVRKLGSGIKSELINADKTVSVSTSYLCDVTSNAIKLTLPATATLVTGDFIEVTGVKGDTATNNVTLDFVTATQNLESVSKNFIMDYNSTFRFVWIDATFGWKAIPISSTGGGSSTGQSITVKSADFYVSNNTTFLVDTSSNPVKAIVPTDITYPYSFTIIDLKGTTGTNNITVDVATNSYNIEGSPTNTVIVSAQYRNEFIATEATYGFKRNMVSVKSVTVPAYNSARSYVKGKLVLKGTTTIEANGDIASNTTFAWGTTGSTWKPVLGSGYAWKGPFSDASTYAINDVVTAYDTIGYDTIYACISTISTTSSDNNPMVGNNRASWKPILNIPNYDPITPGTRSSQAGLVPSSSATNIRKYLSSDSAWSSPNFAITGMLTSSSMTKASLLSGYYIYTVTPSDGLPAGINLNELFYKDSTTGNYYLVWSYSECPTTLSDAANSYIKSASTWVKITALASAYICNKYTSQTSAYNGDKVLFTPQVDIGEKHITNTGGVFTLPAGKAYNVLVRTRSASNNISGAGGFQFYNENTSSYFGLAYGISSGTAIPEYIMTFGMDLTSTTADFKFSLRFTAGSGVGVTLSGADLTIQEV